MAKGKLGYRANKVANTAFIRAGGNKAKAMMRRASRLLKSAKFKANRAGRKYVAKKTNGYRRKPKKRYMRRRY